MCVYIYIYICINVHTYIYTNVCIYIYIYMLKCAYIHIYKCIYICIYIYIYIYTHMHKCTYIHIYKCIYIYICTYINKLSGRCLMHWTWKMASVIFLPHILQPFLICFIFIYKCVWTVHLSECKYWCTYIYVYISI